MLGIAGIALATEHLGENLHAIFQIGVGSHAGAMFDHAAHQLREMCTRRLPVRVRRIHARQLQGRVANIDLRIGQ